MRTCRTTFVLYAGTALALRLGHRFSVDLNFPSFSSVDNDALIRHPIRRQR